MGNDERLVIDDGEDLVAQAFSACPAAEHPNPVGLPSWLTEKSAKLSMRSHAWIADTSGEGQATPE